MPIHWLLDAPTERAARTVSLIRIYSNVSDLPLSISAEQWLPGYTGLELVYVQAGESMIVQGDES
jgi:hypothetical protein